ncbi:unnamed protein product [Boreogadus saida]
MTLNIWKDLGSSNLRYEPLSTVTELPRADVQRPTPGAKSGPEMAMSRATWRRAAHTRRENEERADLAALSPLRNVPLAALLSLTCSPQPSAPSHVGQNSRNTSYSCVEVVTSNPWLSSCETRSLQTKHLQPDEDQAPLRLASVPADKLLFWAWEMVHPCGDKELSADQLQLTVTPTKEPATITVHCPALHSV